MLRRSLRAFAAVACFASAGALAQPAADPFAGAARAYVVRTDGATTWAHAEERPLAPASLTKLMTALVVADMLPFDDVVRVSRTAAAARGARLGLVEGMELRVRDLVVAMLVGSANDACLALAERAAGSEPKFAALMNRRARSMALHATRFTNACGFDAPAHRSSAADLADLAEAFLADGRLAPIVAMREAVVRTRDGRELAMTSTNALLGRVPGAIGVKTGYTSQAGHCLVGLVERDGVRVLVVLLNARDRWWDAVAMIERAFDEARAARRR